MGHVVLDNLLRQNHRSRCYPPDAYYNCNDFSFFPQLVAIYFKDKLIQIVDLTFFLKCCASEDLLLRSLWFSHPLKHKIANKILHMETCKNHETCSLSSWIRWSVHAMFSFDCGWGLSSWTDFQFLSDATAINVTLKNLNCLREVPECEGTL